MSTAIAPLANRRSPAANRYDRKIHYINAERARLGRYEGVAA
jgi:hypothetical protein